MGKFIYPFTDFGFKYIFGSKTSGEFLKDFLNSLFEDDPRFSPITEIKYENPEKTKRSKDEKSVIYDIHCTTSNGKKFIVEMQNGSQEFFVARSVYYVSMTIVEQGEPGYQWHYELMPVYFIGFMNFSLPSLGDKVKVDAMLMDVDLKQPITDKVRYIFIQLPNFKKEASECETAFDKWIYTLKHLDKMETIPFLHDNPVFHRLESVTNYANLSKEEKRQYDHDLKVARDLDATISYAEKRGLKKGEAKGIAKGIAQGRAEERNNMVLSMSEEGFPIETIAKIARLSVSEVRRILEG